MKKRIYELDANECRWPLNENDDGEQLFCCRAAPDGLPYCPGHGRMSTASGNAPTPMNPWGEPEFPRERRDHLDRNADAWRQEQGERELDLVEMLEKDAVTKRYEEGLSERLQQVGIINSPPRSTRPGPWRRSPQ